VTLEVPVVTSLDAGIYQARVTNLETKTTDAGTFRIWSFDVGGEKITASSSMMFGPKSKTYKWVTALIGRSPVPGEKLDVIGLPCQLHLIVDEDSGYNKVEAVLPASGAQPRQSPVPQPARQSLPSDDDSLPPLPPVEEPPVADQFG
jgi:hypothetical protein